MQAKKLGPALRPPAETPQPAKPLSTSTKSPKVSKNTGAKEPANLNSSAVGCWKCCGFGLLISTWTTGTGAWTPVDNFDIYFLTCA
ncbi:hypothetical protein N7532_011324 [Penicillium argentinense]|uniref:Uncharacterized protein n=1 Tax=Penicillium argentinense TaxID=1131581 RepID=A0A9W9EI77_9EURO|nr:uncharacterized protein N7532_011324 [Penicillium argentinense]KAJ5082281.1 hypothetical protein N7532_011324 [Penicillium argentinense]